MKLFNCPFCGSDNVVEERSIRERFSNRDKTSSSRYQIACRNCNCQTGYRLYLDDAVEAWNRRVSHEDY